MSKRIVYFGNFFECMQGIIKENDLVAVISERGKENHRISQFCIEKDIGYKAIRSIEDIRFLVKEFKDIDLFVTGSFGLIFPEDIFSIPRFGTINVHPGYLPFYRGRHPLPWAIRNKEKEVGVAIHVMQEKVDNGPIIERAKMEINYNKGYKDAEEKLLVLIPNLLNKSLKQVFSENRDFIIQHPIDGSYFPPMEPESLTKIINSKVLAEDLR